MRDENLKIGVFYCGPSAVGNALVDECKDWSDETVTFKLMAEHF